VVGIGGSTAAFTIAAQVVGKTSFGSDELWAGLSSTISLVSNFVLFILLVRSIVFLFAYNTKFDSLLCYGISRNLALS
jgi:hypothetical protein